MTSVEDLRTKADKAAAVADAAAAKLADAEVARDQRVTAALRADAERLWKERRFEVRAERDTAMAELDSLVADPDASLPALWTAFIKAKTASAAHAAVQQQAISAMDRWRPKPRTRLGLEQTHGAVRNFDQFEGVRFSDVLDGIATRRAEQARDAAIATEQATLSDALTAAERG